jgi:glycosyltransferase involved in cell wall biosynthesis
LRVLHAIHDFLPRHRAGSEVYAAELCRELGARHHVTMVCAEYDPGRAHGQLTWRLHDGFPVVEIANNWVCATFEETYRPPAISDALERVLDVVQPHVVHVHNLLNLSFDLPAAAKARGIPVAATLHDYTLVCASGGQRIHRADAHVCRTIDPERCARCFVESPFYAQTAAGPVASAMAASGLMQRAHATARRWAPSLVRTAVKTIAGARRLPVTASDITARLAAARSVFDQVDLFVAPSRSLADEFVALGLDPSKLRVVEHGFPRLMPVRRSAGRGPLRIGFVGTLVWHKGVHVLLDAVRRLPAPAYELHIHGDVGTDPDYVADLRRRANGLPVHFRGGFDQSRTASVYGDIDVLVIPSIWLENSPLVIREAFQAGVPVIGSRIGGTADLIDEGRSGRLYDPSSAAELAAILQSIIDDPTQLAAWAAALPPVKDMAEHGREWDRIYDGLAAPITV